MTDTRDSHELPHLTLFLEAACCLVSKGCDAVSEMRTPWLVFGCYCDEFIP